MDRLDDRFDGVFRTVERRRESALVAHGRREAAFVKHLFQGVEHLGTHAHRFGEGAGADRPDHELLESDRCVGVRTAVDDVHHRHGQHVCVHAADVAVERHAEVVGRGMCRSERYAQQGVGAEIRFGRGVVGGQQGTVDAGLVEHAHSREQGSQRPVDVLHGLLNPFAAVAAGIAVAQFERFVFAGRGAAGYGRTAVGARCRRDFDLDGRVAPRVENLSCMYIYNLHSRIVFCVCFIC